MAAAPRGGQRIASPAMLHGLRRRASGHRHLLTGSAALVLTAGVQALSGALFWLIAARVDDQTDVGHATALFTSVLFVAFVAGLGQPVAAARYAAGRTRADHVIFAWGAGATAVAAAIFGVVYLLVVSPPAIDELRDWHGAAGPALFIVLCSGTALSLLLDVRLMTQRRWGLVLGRASIVGFARFPLLLLPVDQDRAVWLLVVAALPTAVSGLRRHGLAPEGHRPPPRVRPDAGHGPRVGPLLRRELGVHDHLPGADVRDAGDRARQRQRRRQRQLLRGLGRRRGRLLRARPPSARRCSPRAGATAPTSAPRCASPSSWPAG